MLNRFLKYIEENQLFLPTDKIILAISGGADSRTMMHLFHISGINVAVAHCNFRLRGEESDGDEVFVKQLAEEYNMPFYSMHFNTNEYAELQKISIQMAARELRYNWFENLRRLHNYNYIATAHNADDAIETFFINLFRGSGIQGLTGIRPRSGNIVHPILFAFRKEIEDYCSKNKLTYRTDSSNNSEKYLRNKIRHSLLSKILEINPEFRTIMKENLSHLSDTEKYILIILLMQSKIFVTQMKMKFIFQLRNSKRTLSPRHCFSKYLKITGSHQKLLLKYFKTSIVTPGVYIILTKKGLSKIGIN